jgi:hypothetical protein
MCPPDLSYIRRREGLRTAVGIRDDLRPVFTEKMVEYLTQHCGINDIAHKDCQNLSKRCDARC